MKTLIYFICVVSVSYLCSQNSFDEKIHFITKPNMSRGYLVWPKHINNHYTLKIYERHYDSDGNIQNRIVLEQTLRSNFYRFRNSMMKNANIYYQVVSNDDETLESDIVQLCAECPTDVRWVSCITTCNGPTYAWSLMSYCNEQESNVILVPNEAVAYISNDVAIPYYEAMSHNVYMTRMYNSGSNWGVSYYGPFYPLPSMLQGTNQWHFVRHNVQAHENIKNAQGTILTGTVHFVGKKMMQFDPLKHIYSNTLLISCNCTTNDGPFIMNQYNQSPESPLPLNLECSSHETKVYQNPLFTPDPSTGSSGAGGYAGGFLDCLSGIQNVTLASILNGIPCLTLGPSDPVVPSNPDNPVISTENMIEIQVTNISESLPTVELNPASVFPNHNPNQPFVSGNNSYPSGIYLINFIFNDGSALPIVLEHDNDEYPIQNNADYISLTVNPNPLENNELNFSISSERFMRFDIELVNSNGLRLHGESLRMNANTELRRTLSLDDMNLTNSLFLNVLFEDGSTFQSQILTTID